MTPVSAGHIIMIILTPTQPVGSMPPEPGSNPQPLDHNCSSRGLNQLSCHTPWVATPFFLPKAKFRIQRFQGSKFSKLFSEPTALVFFGSCEAVHPKRPWVCVY